MSSLTICALCEHICRPSLPIEPALCLADVAIEERIDFKGTLAYVVQLYRPVQMGAQGPVLVDALGRLVCEVLAVVS